MAPPAPTAPPAGVAELPSNADFDIFRLQFRWAETAPPAKAELFVNVELFIITALL